MHHIILFGGTFDPPHFGHLKTAQAVQRTLNPEEFYFLPCKTHALKQHHPTNPIQRIEMLRLALEEYPNFKMDLREIEAETLSHTACMLKSYRQEKGPNVALTFLIGEDAFFHLPKWYQWEKILSLANLLVMRRHGHQSIAESHWCPLKRFTSITQLQQSVCGAIAAFDAGEYDVSSSHVRALLAAGQQDLKTYLPIPVLHYILENGLYV